MKLFHRRNVLYLTQTLLESGKNSVFITLIVFGLMHRTKKGFAEDSLSIRE